MTTLTIVLFLSLISCQNPTSENGSSQAIENNQFQDPLNIGLDSLQSLIGHQVPYDKWEVWGFPETLQGTDNQFWVVYLPDANVSFVSNKSTDNIIFAGFGKNNALKFINDKKK